MGWLFYRREKGETNVEHFQAKLGEGSTILDGATVGGTFYAAVRDPRGLVSCMVVLTRWVPNDPYNFGYKDMDEGMGPHEARCPARILDLLSPTEDLYGPVQFEKQCDAHPYRCWDKEGPHPNQRDVPTGARAAADEWRAACRAELERRGKVRRGSRIRIENINSPYKVWEVADLRRNRFYPVSKEGETITWGFPTRIPWWRSSMYEVVS